MMFEKSVKKLLSWSTFLPSTLMDFLIVYYSKGIFKFIFSEKAIAI